VNQAPEARLAGLLGPAEHLLWSGQPKQGLFLRPADAAVVPFSIMWGGFALFWEWEVMHTSAPFFFRLWGVPFVLAGLYFMVGRFFTDARVRANTLYGLTNQRIIILAGLFASTTKSLSLNTLSELSITERADRSGTITFGPTAPWWASAGFDWSGANRAAAPAFEFIPEVRSVHEQIRAAQLVSSGARTA
jgi:hypothetical protein